MKFRTRIPVKIEGFEGQTIEVRTPGFFSGIELLVNGQPAPRGTTRNEVILHRDDGGEATATWSPVRMGLDLPRLSVDGTTIQYTEALRWYEFAWAWGLPFTFFMVVAAGEAVGGLSGALGAVGDGLRAGTLVLAGFVNMRVFQSATTRTVRYFAFTALVSVLAAGVWLGIDLAIVGQPAAWQVFSSVEGGYSAEFPGNPETSTQQVNAEGNVPILAHAAAVEQGDAAYVVIYADYPRAAIASSTHEARLDGARDGAVSNVRNGKLVSEEAISLNGHPGRDLTVDAIYDSQPVVFRARIYSVDNRAYFVSVTLPKEDAESADVTRFLDSFRLSGLR